jgi:hypothetical protein
MSTAPRHLRYVSTNRRVREDRRFVAGMGQFAADVRPACVMCSAATSLRAPPSS